MSTGPKVLIVDDQEGIRHLLGEVCKMLGYEAVITSSGKEALEKAAGNNIRAALVDMRMPGLNGIETLAGLRCLDPGIRTVLMTGYSEAFLADDALKLASGGILEKPFGVEDIKKCLENIMETA